MATLQPPCQRSDDDEDILALSVGAVVVVTDPLSPFHRRLVSLQFRLPALVAPTWMCCGVFESAQESMAVLAASMASVTRSDLEAVAALMVDRLECASMAGVTCSDFEAVLDLMAED